MGRNVFMTWQWHQLDSRLLSSFTQIFFRNRSHAVMVQNLITAVSRCLPLNAKVFYNLILTLQFKSSSSLCLGSFPFLARISTYTFFIPGQERRSFSNKTWKKNYIHYYISNKAPTHKEITVIEILVQVNTKADESEIFDEKFQKKFRENRVRI